VKLVPTPLAGAYVVELEPLRDERGFFARTYDAAVFEQAGLDARVVQCNTSFNERPGTLRGLHYQAEPHGEGKLVRCTRGAVWDVAVDLRPASTTYCRWFGVELRADGAASYFIHAGLAHGFITLEPGSEVHYQMTYAYVPEAGRGVRWDDPAFGIEWPAAPATLSERDAAYPDFSP
jgi:dTDP-4-dehydrorhamnose 3,5-epimerase